MTIILLIVMSVVSFTVEMAFGDHPETGWIESVAILISVAIIVNVAAATDYFKVPHALIPARTRPLHPVLKTRRHAACGSLLERPSRLQVETGARARPPPPPPSKFGTTSPHRNVCARLVRSGTNV